MSFSFSSILVKDAFNILRNDLHSFGLVSSPEEDKALLSLLNAFNDGISNSLSFSFFLSSLPPGSGKTQAISAFVRAWKSNGFLPGGGILIALKTLDEIESMIGRLGVDRGYVGCFTRDERVNTLGTPDPTSAPVMLTTQQMLASRTSDRSFASASVFHYNGMPRTLRIWDESFVLSEPVSITLYALQALPERLNRLFKHEADQLAFISDQLRSASFGDTLHIPVDLKQKLGAVTASVETKRLHLLPTERTVIDSLRLAAGRELVVRPVGGKGGRALIGSGRPLPADLAPLIITDASGGVRATYEIMGKAQGNLIRLPSVGPDYRNVYIHLWETAVGKDQLRDENRSWPIYRHVAKQMEVVGGEWLVVSFKPADRPEDGLDIEASLNEAVDGKATIRFLNWGRHHGVNAFRHIKNVVVIGSYFYPSEAYEALGMAASGKAARDASELDRAAIKSGEFKHNMLQAVLRGNARNSVNGIAGECNVYIVASPKSHALKLLEATFPGAQISGWGIRPQRPITGHAKALIDALSVLMQPGVRQLPKKVVREAANIKTHELRRTLKQAPVLAYLAENGIKVSTHRFER